MTHGDDRGMVCPPRLAQWQVVVIPIWRSDEEREATTTAARALVADLTSAGIRAPAAAREGIKPGAKYFEWEARGAPLRLELGPRDLAGGSAMMAKRTGGKEPIPMEGIAERLRTELEAMQREMFEAALARREANSLRGPKSREEFDAFLERDGGFVYAGFCGDPLVEAEIKAATKATIRCLPDAEFRSEEPPTTCIWTGRPATVEAVWAKAY
jgi:prolyl-tRNA synthetase